MKGIGRSESAQVGNCGRMPGQVSRGIRRSTGESERAGPAGERVLDIRPRTGEDPDFEQPDFLNRLMPEPTGESERAGPAGERVLDIRPRTVLQSTDSHAIGEGSFLEPASGEGRREFRTWIDVPLENIFSEAYAPTAKPKEPVSVRLGIYTELASVDKGAGIDAQSVRIRIDIQADSPKLFKAVQEKGTDAVAELIANQLETVVFNKVLDSWHALGEANLTEDVQILIELDDKIHEMVIGKPFERLMSGFGLPDSSLMGSIIQRVPIRFIDQPLGTVRLGVEIGGIVTSIMTGNFILAFAYLKALIHDLVHRVLVSAVKGLITQGHSGTADSGKSLVLNARIEHRPISAINFVGQAESRAVSSEVTITGAASVSAAAAEDRRGPGGATVASSSSSAVPASSSSSNAAAAKARRAPGGATVASSSSNAALAEATAKVKQRVGGKSLEFREAGEVLTWVGGGFVHAGSGGWSAPVGKAEELTFVRLRLYYEIERPTISGKDFSQSVRLTRLIVVRDSCRFILPELSKISADVIEECIVRQLDKPASTRAWQLQSVADEDSFALDIASAAALLDTLSKALVGLPSNPHDANFTIQELPLESIDQVLDSDMRCIEIIGFTNGKLGNAKLQCLAFEALIHDDFWNILSMVK